MGMKDAFLHFRAGEEGRHFGFLLLTLESQDLYTRTKVQEYRSNRNVFFVCHSPVVWCPNYRRKLLVGPIEKRLKEIVMQACSKHQAEIEELEVMPEHVHVLVNVDPQFGIQRLVKLIKGCSSRFLRQDFPELTRALPTRWTNSSCVSTPGGAPLGLIKQSIEQQNHV